MNKETRDFMQEKLNSYCKSKGTNCDGCILRNCDCNFISCTDQQLEYIYIKVFPNYKNEDYTKQNENKHSYKEEIKYLEEEKRIISSKLDKLYRKQDFEEIKKHEIYIGKCYKSKSENKYYKVLSNYSINSTRMTCLTFDLDEDIYIHKFNSTLKSFYFPNIDVDLNLFEIEDVFAFGSPHVLGFLDTVYEIEQSEFKTAMSKMIEKFIDETNKFHDSVQMKVDKYKDRYL